MSAAPARWPAPVRRLVGASTDAVLAAAARDADALEDAGSRLGACDPELVRVLLGHVVTTALSAAHPGGLDGDDVAEVLTATVRDAEPWWPADPEVVLAVLLGAVGAHVDEQAALDPRAVAEHAALVAAHVLDRRGRPRAPADGSTRPAAAPSAAAGPAALQRDLDAHLSAAVAELERVQTVEMP